MTKASTLGFGPSVGSPDDGSNGGSGLILLGRPAPTNASQVAPPATYKVPNLKGRKLKAVKQAIRSAGCAVGKVTVAKGAGAAKAKVASQQPAPGKEVTPGAKVAVKLG